MGTFLLTGILILLAITALIFLRGGAKEPVTDEGPPGRVSPVEPRESMTQGPGSAGERAAQLIRALGYEIARTDREGSGPGFVAVRRAPTGEERIYVRAYDLPPGERVREPEVVAELDVAHAEGVQKTLLVSPNGFTDEAVLAAEDSIAELVDAERLDQMMRATAASVPQRPLRP